MNDETKKTHPGFTITCDACGGSDVYVDNTVGFSSVSGAWGEVSLICRSCDAETAIWEPS